MATRRKSRSVNKRFSGYADLSPDKDFGNLNKSRQRKRKLSDMLGSQWSKEELERFYEAYRKYGKDWKKVAGVVCNRSFEMVEALYNMNRAYLSLPEGTASVVGLIAMMTDHYNVLEGSYSDRESSDASRLSQKPQKHGRGKVQLNTSKEDILQSHSIASTDGCLSLLKRRRPDGRAVGKRTPRFPVSHSSRKDGSQNHGSPQKKGRKSEVDDDVAHVAALALTEASQRGGFPQISQSPYRTEQMRPSPLKSSGRTHSQSEMAQAKRRGNLMDLDGLEGSLGCRGDENGDFARDASALIDIEGVGMVEVHQKGKKVHGKKEKVEDVRMNHFDDGREACSGTEEGLNVADDRGKVETEVTNAKMEGSTSQGKRKKKKKLFFGDESSALDALQTLADLSLMMPASTVESESSVQLKEEKPTFDLAYRCSILEAVSTSHRRNKTKLSGAREKVHNASSGVEASTSGNTLLGRDSVDFKAISVGQLEPQPSNKTLKRKRKSSSFKSSKSEGQIDSHVNELSEAGDFAEEEEKIVNKVKCSGQNFASSNQWKSIRSVECSSSNSDQKRTGTDSAVSTAQIPATSEVNLTTKQRNRRKMNPKKIVILKEMKFPEISSKDCSNKYLTLEDKDKLSCCLSSYMIRRWCTYEWFYSAIDYPWFAIKEFVEYLNHVGLGNIPRLTRVEWGVIRSSLGKPRRFSEHFLHEERAKLNQYRESVRKHYTELRAGIREGLPTDLALPLSVGQRVIALHPKSREVHDGSVLTVDHDKCRIQFDRPELGVEFVMDVDCMPLSPLDNMPEALRRQNTAVHNFSVSYREPRLGQGNIGGSMLFITNENLENVLSPINTLMKRAKEETNYAISLAKAADFINVRQPAYSQPSTMAHIHAREADIQALSELSCALDKKEVLLMELKHANDGVLKNQNDGDNSLQDSEPFKKQYATVLLQLKEASNQVSSALLNLRQRNTYPANPMPGWLKLPVTSSGLGDPTSSFGNSLVSYQELGANVVEIVKDSRLQAHTMVDSAIRAISAMKEGEDAFARLGEALDSLNKQKSTLDSEPSMIRSPEQVNGGVAHQHQLTSTSEPLPIGQLSALKSHHDSDRIEAQIPSELITSCVVTLLMIQMCTERQYPPADVAQILDSAVTSLHPCCPQNLPIYREIQMCMGRIKTQILALVPT